MARRSVIRASDEDRDLVADRLREATGEGRLLPGELEERLAAALRARTHGQLALLVSDLPARGDRRPAIPLWARATLGVAGAVGVLAAAAAAAMLFTLIAAVSAAWMLLGRVLGARGRHVRRGEHARNLAAANRQALPRGVPRGGRASF